MSLTRIVPPTEEPVTLAEAKLQLRITADDSQDDYITALIAAAREYCEEYQGRSYLIQQHELLINIGDMLTGYAVDLPRPPLKTLDAVETLDEDGVATTISASDYTLDTTRGIPRLTIDTMPTDAEQLRARYTAGYNAAGDVPARTRHAILLLVTHWYLHREPVVTNMSQITDLPHALIALLNMDRCNWGM